MTFRLLLIGVLLAGPSGMLSSRDALAAPSKQACQRGCNQRCHGANNKSKCVNQCRRAC